jgi:hypothetical protein
MPKADSQDRDNVNLIMMSSTTNLLPALKALQVPPDFAHYSRISDSAILTRLEKWKSTALRGLSDLHVLMKQENFKLGGWSLELQADVVSAVAPFEGGDAWTACDSRELARSR